MTTATETQPPANAEADSPPRCAVATGSEVCPFCDGKHDWSDCPVVYTPITDCEYKDAEDGCCLHPKNMTPRIGFCRYCGTKLILSGGWVPSYNDPDNAGGAPEAEPTCPTCEADLERDSHAI